MTLSIEAFTLHAGYFWHEFFVSLHIMALAENSVSKVPMVY